MDVINEMGQELAHEVATRARGTIQKWNHKWRLKEREAALQQRE